MLNLVFGAIPSRPIPPVLNLGIELRVSRQLKKHFYRFQMNETTTVGKALPLFVYPFTEHHRVIAIITFIFISG